MPKMKSHSGAKKRFTFTASGKLKHAQQNKRHILTKKTGKRKRQPVQPAMSILLKKNNRQHDSGQK